MVRKIIGMGQLYLKWIGKQIERRERERAGGDIQKSVFLKKVRLYLKIYYTEGTSYVYF